MGIGNSPEMPEFITYLKGRNLEKIVEFVSLHMLASSKDLQNLFDSSNPDNIHTFWDLVYEVIQDCFPYIAGKEMDENVNMTLDSLSKSLCIFAKIIFLSLDVMKVAPVSLLNATIYFNEHLTSIPAEYEDLRDGISVLCVKYWVSGYPQHNKVVHNVTMHVLMESLRVKRRDIMKTQIKKLFSIKETLKSGLQSKDAAYKKQLLTAMTSCMQSSDYLSLSEGRKLLSYMLCLDASLIDRFHEKVKANIPSCTQHQCKVYGEIYFTSWMESFNAGTKDLCNALEWVIQEMMEKRIFIPKQTGCILPQLNKFVSVFHGKRDNPNVLKLLCRLYAPLLWKGLEWHHGSIRANAAHVFFDVFPLEDPDLKIVEAQNELNRQTVIIQTLLTDRCPMVRCIATIGVCTVVALQWEILSKEVIGTYFLLLTERLAKDKYSQEVRLAVINGIRILLENHFENHVLRVVLSQLSILFYDKDEKVRIAFCRLLLDVKRDYSIQYWGVVPMEELLNKLDKDTMNVRKLIVELICNSYIPVEEPEICWLQRSVELIKQNLEKSRNFFYFVPEVLDLEHTAKFIVFIFKVLNLFVKTKTKREMYEAAIKGASSETEDRSFIEDDLVKLLEADGDMNIIIGVVDAASIMFHSSLQQFGYENNKTLYKSLIHKISKYMHNLLPYFKEPRQIWIPLYCISSMIPESLLPEFPKMCFAKFDSLLDDDDEDSYTTLVKCMCEMEKCPELLQSIMDSLICEFEVSSVYSLTKSKRRSSLRAVGVQLKPLKATRCLQCLLITEETCNPLVNDSLDQLKEFLPLLDSVQERIVQAKMSLCEEEKEFLALIVGTIALIPMLIHESKLAHLPYRSSRESTHRSFDVDGFFTKLLKWISDTFLSTPEATRIPSSRRKSRRISSPSSNAVWIDLGLSICQSLCIELSYVVSLYVLEKPAVAYMAFMKDMIHSEHGPELVCSALGVVCHLSNHCKLCAPRLEQQKENEHTILDIFPQIIVLLRDEDFYGRIPNDFKKKTFEFLTSLLQSQSEVMVLPEIPVKILIPQLLDGVMHGAVPIAKKYVEGKDEFVLPLPSISLISVVQDDSELFELFLEAVMTYVKKEGLIESAAACAVIIKTLEGEIKKPIIHKLLQLLKVKAAEFSSKADSSPNRDLISFMDSSIAHIQQICAAFRREQKKERISNSNAGLVQESMFLT